MQLTLLASLFAVLTRTRATLAPCIANVPNAMPGNIPCQPCLSSPDIQEAECASNTRCHSQDGHQTFAIFVRDTSKINRLNVPLGTCFAFSDACQFFPTVNDLMPYQDVHTFFWYQGSGGTDGQGTDCIRDFKSGQCKCENSDGSSILVGYHFVIAFEKKRGLRESHFDGAPRSRAWPYAVARR